MPLSSAKCSFGVQAGKFSGFMLIRMGNKVNLDKCHIINDVKSPYYVKEVRRLPVCLVALYYFLYYVGYKAFHLFGTLKNKNEKFELTNKCDEVHMIDTLFATFPILTRPEAGVPIHFYL